MSEPKLYEHNETGERVMAFPETSNLFVIFIIRDNGIWGWERQDKKTFEDNYTPLPEPPEEGSTAWAVCQALEGKIVKAGFITSKGLDYIELKKENDYGLIGGKDQRGNRYTLQLVLNRPNLDTKRTCDRITFVPNYQWEIVEEPKPIVEKLPHKFVEGEEILYDSGAKSLWRKGRFSGLRSGREEYPFLVESCLGGKSASRAILPYKLNKHLKDTKVTCDSGAMPKGYFPPHVPKLGDADYWQVGDMIINLATDATRTIKRVGNTKIITDEGDNNINIDGTMVLGLMRVWFHYGSTVEKEHIPTRPHRIEE